VTCVEREVDANVVSVATLEFLKTLSIEIPYKVPLVAVGDVLKKKLIPPLAL
jgi:hypothetical protein